MDPSPTPTLRRTFWITAGLFVFAGCAAVHQRQALYPNGIERTVGARDSKARPNRTPAPRVDLRIEPDSDPRSTGTAKTH
jgi:hypothetical protein